MRKGRRKRRFFIELNKYKQYCTERADEVLLAYRDKKRCKLPFKSKIPRETYRILKLALYDLFIPPTWFNAHRRKYGKRIRQTENLYFSKVYAGRYDRSSNDN